MADHTPYQRKIIDRYYKNFDAIKYQRLSELATDLYLAEGKKLDRLWSQVESSLRKLEFPEPRIAELIRKPRPGSPGRDSQGTRERIVTCWSIDEIPSPVCLPARVRADRSVAS